MNQQIVQEPLVMDVTPDHNTVWDVNEVVSAVWPTFGADGRLRMMPAQWCEDTGAMELIPAYRQQNVLTWAPEAAYMVPELLQPSGNQPLRHAAMASMFSRAMATSQKRKTRLVERVIDEHVVNNPLLTAAVMVFAARIVDHDGGAGGMVMFTGDPNQINVRSFGNNGRLTWGNPKLRLLTPAWQGTEIADELANIAAQGNAAAASAVPCYQTAEQRQSALNHWRACMQRIDALAGDYLQSTLPVVLRGRVAYPSIVQPWMRDIYEVARHHQLANLPAPKQTVGGCHKVMSL